MKEIGWLQFDLFSKEKSVIVILNRQTPPTVDITSLERKHPLKTLSKCDKRALTSGLIVC